MIMLALYWVYSKIMVRARIKQHWYIMLIPFSIITGLVSGSVLGEVDPSISSLVYAVNLIWSLIWSIFFSRAVNRDINKVFETERNIENQKKRQKEERERQERERQERENERKRYEERKRELENERKRLYKELIDYLKIPYDIQNRIVSEEYMEFKPRYKSDNIPQLWKHPTRWLYECKDGSPDLRYSNNEIISYEWWYIFFGEKQYGIKFYSDNDMEHWLLLMEKAGNRQLGYEWEQYKIEKGINQTNTTYTNNNAQSSNRGARKQITKARFIKLRLEAKYPNECAILELNDIDEITEEVIKDQKKYLLMKNHPDRFPEKYKEKQEDMTKQILEAVDTVLKVIEDTTKEMKEKNGNLKI